MHPAYKHGNGNVRGQTKKEVAQLNYWKKEVLKACNIQCFITGFLNTPKTPLVCHHLESWNKNPDLRFDVKNGVVLVRSLHKEFHELYGFGNNTALQFEKFAFENYNINYFPWRDGNHEPSVIFKNRAYLKTVPEIKQKEIEQLIEKRGHQLIKGAYENCRSSLIIFCSIHKKETVTCFTNYKKSKYGCLCCARAKQSKSVQISNRLRKANRIIKNYEGAETRE